MTIASDKGHYYTQTGEPAYTIIGANGKERNTTIRDARKLGLVPSVTEILKLYPKPALTIWKMKNVLMSALTLPRIPLESDEAFTTRIMMDAEEQSRKAAERGTTIHGEIERAIQGHEPKEEYASYVIPTLTALINHLEMKAFGQCSVEKSFAHPLGFGGKVDFHSQELNFVCDFKTKAFDENTKPLAWDENKIQLIAYRYGLGMPEDTRLINVFISTIKPGLVKVVEHEYDKRYLAIFLNLMALWKQIKNYEVIPGVLSKSKTV